MSWVSFFVAVVLEFAQVSTNAKATSIVLADCHSCRSKTDSSGEEKEGRGGKLWWSHGR